MERLRKVGSALGTLARVEARSRSAKTQRYFAPEPASPIRYEPDTKLADICRQDAERESVLTCRHGKFYWHVCTKCHRDSKQAKAYKEYLKRKLA